MNGAGFSCCKPLRRTFPSREAVRMSIEALSLLVITPYLRANGLFYMPTDKEEIFRGQSEERKVLSNWSTMWKCRVWLDKLLSILYINRQDDSALAAFQLLYWREWKHKTDHKGVGRSSWGSWNLDCWQLVLRSNIFSLHGNSLMPSLVVKKSECPL